MRAQMVRFSSVALHAALGLAAVLAAASVSAQTLRVTAASAFGGQVYDVSFSGAGGSVAQINSDASQLKSPVSVVYIANLGTGSVDALVADSRSGSIVRYANVNPYASATPPAAEASTLVWSLASGPGPCNPDGMSVDASGNLYVLSSGNHKAPGQLWVFPSSGAAGSGFGAPRLLDASFNGTFEQELTETAVSPVANGAVGVGDVLLLADDPMPAVFAYAAADIQNFLSLPYCNPTTATCPTVSARTLIQIQAPARPEPNGMDFWPADGSLLIADGSGTIYRYGFAGGVATAMSPFASALGNGLQKIKTGVQAGVPYAFVTQASGGKILELGAPPPSPSTNPPLATVTVGNGRPDGLAVSNVNAALASTCQQAGGCDLLGGVIPHSIIGTLTGSNALTTQYAIESVCVVQVDPRWASGTYSAVPLPVSQVCPGYGGATLPNSADPCATDTCIPAYLRGGSGASGHGFALIKNANDTDINPATGSSIKGTLVLSQANSNNVLPPPSPNSIGANPACPLTVVGWGPLPSEGSVLALDPLNLDPVTGLPVARPLLEMTTYCDASAAHTSGMSVFGIGLVLDVGALPQTPNANPYVNFAASKYGALISALNAPGIISSKLQSSLLACVRSSLADFNAKNYCKAALVDLPKCDAIVAANESSFYASWAPPQAPQGSLNPSGEIRGRIANLFLSINSGILGASTTGRLVSSTTSCPNECEP